MNSFLYEKKTSTLESNEYFFKTVKHKHIGNQGSLTEENQLAFEKPQYSLHL